MIRWLWWWWFGPNVKLTWNNCDKCKLIGPFPDDLLLCNGILPPEFNLKRILESGKAQVFLRVRWSPVIVCWEGIGLLVRNDESHTVMGHNGALIGGRDTAW